MKNRKTSDIVDQKKYLSIGEVAQKFGLSVEVLRKWEKDFPRVLHPMRTKGDSRLYDQKQVEKVAIIHRLLRIEGLSIEGARRRLSQQGQNAEETRQSVISRLISIRQQLMDIVNELDQIDSNSTSSITA